MLTYIRKNLFLCILIFAQPTLTWADIGTRTALSYLTNMVEAHKKSSYELLYILQQNGQLESFRLRHTFIENKAYAQLLNLDHSREEIILNGNTVSYLGQNFRPFSLNSSSILDNSPNVLYTDYNRLTGYVFLDAGNDRISDRSARVIRLVPTDRFRYAYTLWIDEKTNLLLKSQLLDKHNVALEEFRVLHLYQSSELEMIASAINSLILPPISRVEKENIQSPYKLSVNWLPLGFHLIESQTMSGKQYALENESIDSRLYSDGLSTFNIYIMPSQGISFNEYAWQQGKLTILNQTINGNDIVIIGEIPLESAQRILKNIQFLEENSQ